MKLNLNDLKPCSCVDRSNNRIFGWYTGHRISVKGKHDYDVIMVPIIDDDNMFRLHVVDNTNDQTGDPIADFVSLEEIDGIIHRLFQNNVVTTQ